MAAGWATSARVEIYHIRPAMRELEHTPTERIAHLSTRETAALRDWAIQQKEHHVMPRKSNTAVVTIGIDPGKNTLHLVGLDARGGIVLRAKVARARIVCRLANVPPCLIGIEAGKRR